METKTKHLDVAEFSPSVLLPIEKIDPDPNQPRRTLEEIEDMALSIKTNNIMQPIMVRPAGDRYQIIFGERRYQAAVKLGMKEIPATVKDATDEEALEMQIVENLQRNDLNPMQQARGFHALAEKRQMKVDEIALRVGKPLHFVRQQLKLNDLTGKWQSLLLKDAIPLGIALKICTLSEDAQNDLYKNQVDSNEARKARPLIQINTHLILKYKGELARACFDTHDPELDKKMGACSQCPFNSALTSLFPEDQKDPRCNNVLCFKNKIALHINREIEKTINDPSTIMVYEGYPKPEFLEKLKTDGAEIMQMGYGEECRQVRKPEAPVWETLIVKNKQEKLPEKKLRSVFKELEKKYIEEQKTFEEKLAIGKYKRSLVVSSNNYQAGKYVYVELTPKQAKKATKKTIENGNSSIEDIDTEITRVQNRERRAKELDVEKVFKKIVESVKSDKNLNTVPKKSTSFDNAMITFLLLEHLNMDNRESVQKTIKSPALWHPKDHKSFQNALQTISKTQLTYLIRKVIISKYSHNLPNTPGGYIFRLMAESLGTVPIPDLEAEQREIAQKRQTRVNQNIAILKEMRGELVKVSQKINHKKAKVEEVPA